MKPGDVVEVYLNPFDEPATDLSSTENRKALGIIMAIFEGVTDPTYEELEILVEGKLMWFYGNEVHPVQEDIK